MKNFEKSESEIDVYNMAVIFTFRLNKMLEEVDMATLIGDFERWHNILDAICNAIDFKLNDKDRKELADLFKAVQRLLFSIQPSGRIMEINRQRYLFNLRKALGRLTGQVNQILNKNHMIFPKKDQLRGMAKAMERYKLKKGDE